MDMNVMQALMAISFAWFRAHHWVSSPVQLRVQISYQPPSRLGQAPVGIAASLASGRTTHHVLAAYVHNVVLTTAAESQEISTDRQQTDAWSDNQLMHFLKEQRYPAGTTDGQRTRIRKGLLTTC
jgi:hypothetical protein